jgi:hypothetical protein
MKSKKRFELNHGTLLKSMASLWASVLLPLLIIYGVSVL